MAETYSGHYDLQDRLGQEPRIIPAPPLYNFDDRAVYSAILARLAETLPNGDQSPFSARTPTSAESQLIGGLVHLQSLIAHELNLLPDLAWIQMFRMLGVQMLTAEYPVIAVTFTRAEGALTAIVPAGMEVRSTSDASLAAIALEDRLIEFPETTVTVACRLNRTGVIESVRAGEFSLVPQLSTGLSAAFNDGTILVAGRNEETLPEAMLRARLQFQRGLRCVTPIDFYNAAIEVGARQANVLPGTIPGVTENHRGMTSVIVWPPDIASAVDAAIRPVIVSGTLLGVYPAEVIPIAGQIEVRGTTNLSNQEARDLAATAIVQQVNPPFGTWGDNRFDKTVATAIENERGVYAVPVCNLIHAETGQPLTEMVIKPWQLLEIQASTEITAA